MNNTGIFTLSGRSRLYHLSVLIVIAVLMAVAYHGGFNAILDILIKGHIDDVNRGYLASSLHESDTLLEIISGMKVLLALLQSSSGGISFIVDVEIRLGETMNVLVELINQAWQFSVASVAANHAMSMLLDLSYLATAPTLTLFFALYGLSLSVRSRAINLSVSIERIAQAMLFIVLFVHLAIPLAIYGTATASHYLFQDYRGSIKSEFQQHYDRMPKHNATDSLHSQVKTTIDQFNQHQKDADKQSESLSSLTIKHIVVVVIEGLVLPVLLLLGLLMLFKSLIQIITVESREK